MNANICENFGAGAGLTRPAELNNKSLLGRGEESNVRGRVTPRRVSRQREMLLQCAASPKWWDFAE